MNAIAAGDPRVIAADSDRIVLKIRRPEEARSVPLLVIGSGLLAAVAVVTMWFAFDVSLWLLAIVWLLVTLSAVLFVTREGTLVALRRENQIFVEWRNTLTRRKRRTLAAQLTDLSGYEVRSVVDLETDVPYQVYELRLAIGDKSAVWYCASREVAETIGEALLRLRP